MIKNIGQAPFLWITFIQEKKSHFWDFANDLIVITGNYAFPPFFVVLDYVGFILTFITLFVNKKAPLCGFYVSQVRRSQPAEYCILSCKGLNKMTASLPFLVRPKVRRCANDPI
jgi:hypothetical protein